MVDPAQPTQQSDMEILAVPKELALSIQEIVKLYHQNKQAVLESLTNLIADSKSNVDNAIFSKQTLVNYTNILDADNDTEFLKSWDDIFNVQIYIDTDIYGELDSRPPALTEVRTGNSIDSETVIQHTEATEAYIQSWKDLAKSMSAFPDDLFTRLWTTIEIAKILETSPSTLRRARKSGRLPIKIKNMILDCISHDGKRSLWFVRPS